MVERNAESALSEQPVEVLRQARDYLVTHGWAKGSFKVGRACCAVAAVATVQGKAEVYQAEMNAPHLDTLPGITLLNAAVEAVGPRTSPDAWHPVAMFNDAEETTFDDVIDLFDKAIELAEAS